jgi:hypothetical protein
VLQTDIGTLLERTASEKTPTKQNASTNIPETESLNWNSIASDELSTTAIHYDHESRRSSAATFDFDPIIANSKIYQRTLTASKRRTFGQIKTAESEVSSGSAELAPSEKPEKLVIDVVESVDVETSEPTASSDRLSRAPRSTQKFKSTRLSNKQGTFVVKAARNALMRNKHAIRHEIRSRTSASPQQPTLELVVTGYGGAKLSVVRSVSSTAH